MLFLALPPQSPGLLWLFTGVLLIRVVHVVVNYIQVVIVPLGLGFQQGNFLYDDVFELLLLFLSRNDLLDALLQVFQLFDLVFLLVDEQLSLHQFLLFVPLFHVLLLFVLVVLLHLEDLLVLQQ